MRSNAARRSRRPHPGLARLQSDERLVERAKKGDQRAFEAIFERYHQDLYRFCLTLTGSRQDAEDALQGAMVKLMRALPGEPRDIRLRPWIYRIARNEAIDTVRRRREVAAVAPEQVAPGPGLAETAEARERLGRLIDDLGELPERQRAALVMRELGDLEFAEIAVALETSAEAARQAVYEARVSLRHMEAGREMTCDEVVWAITEADGRVIRRREIQAHLRECADCRAFQGSIARRRGELRAISPLPVAASAALLQGALGAGSGPMSGGLAGAAGTGAGKALLSSTVVKTAATCAVVAAIGTTAADRSGLVDLPLGGNGGQTSESTLPTTPPPARSSAPSKAARSAPGAAVGRSSPKRANSSMSGGTRPAGAGKDGRTTTTTRANGNGTPAATSVPPGQTTNGNHGGHSGAKPKKNAAKRGQGNAPGLPASSAHGQQTAAAHKSPQANASPGTPRGTAKGNAPSSPAAQPDTNGSPEKTPPPAAPAAEPPAKGKGGNTADRAAEKPPAEAEPTE